MQIRFATVNDIEGIIEFLRNNWTGNTVLVKSPKIFRYQYCWDGNCNFVLAVDELTNEIIGLKGFIPLNHEAIPDMAEALAIVKSGIRPLLGMEMQKFLEKETKARYLCSTGLNPNTSYKIYQLFKRDYTVGHLDHYYRLGDMKQYQIATVKAKRILEVNHSDYSMKLLSTFEEFCQEFDLERFKEHKPYKEPAYIKYRYYNHLVYSYLIYGIYAPGSAIAEVVFFAREVEQNGSKVLRIVDCIGNKEALRHGGFHIQHLIEERGYEYVDFYCWGISENIMNEFGFVLRRQDDENIIPNYFEPFVSKNIDIYFFHTGKGDDITIFKADGDQDRPNIGPEEYDAK